MGRERMGDGCRGGGRLTVRDMRLLLLVGEMYGLRTDQIGDEAGTGETRTLQLNRRYREAGLMESARILHGEAAYHWLTRAGLREVGLPFRSCRPAATLLHHHYATAVVRRMFEQHPRGEARWVSERWLRHQKRTAAHVPDGLVQLHGDGSYQIAIEVELTQKSIERQREITKDLAAYDEVWLYTAPGVTCKGYEKLNLRTEEIDLWSRR